MAEESACPLRRHNRTNPYPHYRRNRFVWTCLSTIFCKNRQTPPHRRGQNLRHKPHIALPLPAFPHHRGLVRKIHSSMSVRQAATLLSAQIYFFAVLLTLCFTCPAATPASELTQPTAEAFQRYLQRTEGRMQSELADPEHFLYFDSLPEELESRDTVEWRRYRK